MKNKKWKLIKQVERVKRWKIIYVRNKINNESNKKMKTKKADKSQEKNRN